MTEPTAVMNPPHTTPPPAAQKKTAARTSPYLVLTKAGDKDSWKTVDTVTAKNPDDAIELAVGKLSEELQAGVYVAIATKRWNPATIKPKVERSLVLTRVK